jgi:hypothetical protein
MKWGAWSKSFMMLATSKIRLDVIKGMPKIDTGLEKEGESVLICRKLDHFSFLATLYLRIPKPIGNSVISVDQFIKGKLRQNESHAMEVQCSCTSKAFFSNTDAINTTQPNSSDLSSPTSVLKHAGTFPFFFSLPLYCEVHIMCTYYFTLVFAFRCVLVNSHFSANRTISRFIWKTVAIRAINPIIWACFSIYIPPPVSVFLAWFSNLCHLTF